MKTNNYGGELTDIEIEMRNDLTEEEKQVMILAKILTEGFLWQEEQKYKEKHPELYSDQDEKK